MTPMVDVAFLLLIFFMVTTVFRRPLAMEVNMPEPGAKVEVPESNVMTVYVDRDETMFAKIGKDDPQPVTWEDLGQSFTVNAAANPDLIILVKIHREARYEPMVDMMDTAGGRPHGALQPDPHEGRRRRKPWRSCDEPRPRRHRVRGPPHPVGVLPGRRPPACR